jgi:hypothetical protein
MSLSKLTTLLSELTMDKKRIYDKHNKVYIAITEKRMAVRYDELVVLPKEDARRDELCEELKDLNTLYHALTYGAATVGLSTCCCNNPVRHDMRECAMKRKVEADKNSWYRQSCFDAGAAFALLDDEALELCEFFDY